MTDSPDAPGPAPVAGPVAGPVVGMVGAGQLARMTAQAAIGLGVGFRVLAGSAADSAAQVAAGTRLGDYRSLADLRDFAAECDVLTFDHEHVPGEHLAALEQAGVRVRPGGAALRATPSKTRPCYRPRLGADSLFPEATLRNPPQATHVELGQPHPASVFSRPVPASKCHPR